MLVERDEVNLVEFENKLFTKLVNGGHKTENSNEVPTRIVLLERPEGIMIKIYPKGYETDEEEGEILTPSSPKRKPEKNKRQFRSSPRKIPVGSSLSQLSRADASKLGKSLLYRIDFGQL